MVYSRDKGKERILWLRDVESRYWTHGQPQSKAEGIAFIWGQLSKYLDRTDPIGLSVYAQTDSESTENQWGQLNRGTFQCL